MHTNKATHLLILVLMLTVLVACAQSNQQEDVSITPDGLVVGTYTGLAIVEGIEIRPEETFPVEVTVIARGYLPNSCAAIDQVGQNQIGSTFRVSISVIHEADPQCDPVPVPFEQAVTLDVIGLPSGVYVIDVNGLQGTFTMREDNVPDDGNAVVSGQIWSDRCLSIGEGSEFSGCIEQEDGSLAANGLPDMNEHGLGGVVVNLGAGICPSIGLASAMTDVEGYYLFSGLRAGTYCVSVDAESDLNSVVLGSGEWTNAKESIRGAISAVVHQSGSITDLDFGWSYLSPEEEPVGIDMNRTECSDVVSFVSDVTIPDDSVLSSTTIFTKTWQLRNEGTCIWQPGYSLVFAKGDSMRGPGFIPLGKSVSPGQTIDLSVVLVAPVEPGSYRGEWMLRNGKGILFGAGSEADSPFWLQIIVRE